VSPKYLFALLNDAEIETALYAPKSAVDEAKFI
jgi:hypothetical protein